MQKKMQKKKDYYHIGNTANLDSQNKDTPRASLDKIRDHETLMGYRGIWSNFCWYQRRSWKWISFLFLFGGSDYSFFL